MFKISRKTDYAVRVLLTLARHGAGKRVATQRVQEQTLVPLAFLQRIVATLRRAQLLRAYTGSNGGLELAREAHGITLLDVYTAMEGPVDLSECVQLPGSCPLAGPCPVRPRWGRLQTAITDEMSRTTLAELAAETVDSGAVPPRRSRHPLRIISR